MKFVLFTLLIVVVLGMMINPVFAEPISKKYYTQPFWIYQIEIEYTGDTSFSVFWNGIKISDPIPDEKLKTTKIEVYATTNETFLQIFDTGDDNNLSADVRIVDVSEIRRMSVDEIRNAKSLGVEDPKDRRIAELEDRVSVLEHDKKELEIQNTELFKTVNYLQKQVDNLKVQLDNANAIIREQLNVIVNTLANLKIG